MITAPIVNPAAVEIVLSVETVLFVETILTARSKRA